MNQADWKQTKEGIERTIKREYPHFAKITVAPMPGYKAEVFQTMSVFSTALRKVGYGNVVNLYRSHAVQGDQEEFWAVTGLFVNDVPTQAE